MVGKRRGHIIGIFLHAQVWVSVHSRSLVMTKLAHALIHFAGGSGRSSTVQYNCVVSHLTTERSTYTRGPEPFALKTKSLNSVACRYNCIMYVGMYMYIYLSVIHDSERRDLPGSVFISQLIRQKL